MKRKYLGLFLLEHSKPEHVKIIEVLRSASAGDVKQVFVIGTPKSRHVIAFLFTAQLLPWQIDFSKVLLNGDERLIVELGETHMQTGLNVADTWLRSHQDFQQTLR